MANPTKFRAKRRDVLRGAAAAAVTGIAGFPGLVLGQSNPKTVKIGVIFPMTGMFAYNGAQSMAGAKLAADEINAKGGIKSLGGAKIELVIGDSQSKPEAAVAEVDKLSEQGVAAFLGGYASGIALTATQASARNKVPFMVDGPVSDQVTSRGLYGVFRFSPGFKRITDVALDNLVNINKAAGNPAKTVALVYEDGAFGSGLAKFLAAELPKLTRTSKRPILLVSPQIRAGLKQMTSANLPRLVVMSFNEITRDTKVEIVGIVNDA